MKNNKTPISKKNESKEVYTDVFQNELDLDPALKAELESKGLVGRFINATLLRKNHGVHRAKWQPYQRESKGINEALFGQDADKFVRRGDLILAVKSKEEVARHKVVLKQRARDLSNTQAAHAAELRKLAAESGVNTSISTGYDGADEGEE